MDSQEPKSSLECLDVTPISSIPFVNLEAPMAKDNESAESSEAPSWHYFVCLPSKEELDNIFSVNKNAIVVSGSAANTGEPNLIVGNIDIAESEETYFFRVSLPGVAKENFSCMIVANGQVMIKGATVTGEEIVYRNSMKFVMQSQNLCQPGPFSVSFNLPGPINPDTLNAELSFGVLEGEVQKTLPSNS